MNTAVIHAPTSQSIVVAHAMSVAELKTQVKRIREAMKAVMQPGVHYGVIPGTPKPTLYKPGSELLLSMFRIAAEPIVDDLTTDDQIRYRVKVRGVHSPTDTVVGWGIGECATAEEKYMWRAAVCDEEFDDTDDDRKRIKYKKWWDKDARRHQVDRLKQVRTSPSDLANTVLKMAKKRGQIDLTLTATGASDVFNQDIEDLQAELRDTIIEGEPPAGDDNQGGAGGGQQQRQQQTRGKPATSAPRSRSASSGNSGGGTGGGNGRCTDRQANLIKVKLDQAGISENEFFDRYQINAIAELPFAKVNEALAWIANPGEPAGDRQDDLGDGRS